MQFLRLILYLLDWMSLSIGELSFPCTELCWGWTEREKTKLERIWLHNNGISLIQKTPTDSDLPYLLHFLFFFCFC